MSNILKILKGSLIGLGSILPGVSGGMIAAAFDIYKDLINALNLFTKEPIKAVISIWQYLIGIALGIFVGFLLIKTVLDRVPLLATLLFIGLILGSIPSLIREVKSDDITVKHYITAAVTVVIMVGFLFIKPSTQIISGNYVMMFIAGGLMALSFIIPGLSGTMLLMAIGVYATIVDKISLTMKAVVSFDFANIFPNAWSLLVMAIGLVVVILLSAKAIAYLLKSYKTFFYFAILGIVFMSPINILHTLSVDEGINLLHIPWHQYAIGAILLVLGLVVAYKMSGEKDETKET